MYNTGQYDYQILQALNNIYGILQQIFSVVSDIADNILPILCVCGLVVGFISLVNWLVKL